MEPQGLTDVRYEVADGVAVVTIDRPERMNAFRAKTVEDLIACFEAAWTDTAVGAIVLTGAGERAFCAGGDLRQRNNMTDAAWQQPVSYTHLTLPTTPYV